MDITFRCDDQKFNYRVCAMMIIDGGIPAMHDDRSPYYYLPGGRVNMGETAEHAVVREIQEELDVIPKIVRPLWLKKEIFDLPKTLLSGQKTNKMAKNGCASQL